MRRPRPIILDCDPGIDDAMALYFALAHPAIDLRGITTTFGNVAVAQATCNALYLCALAGRRLPVCAGASTPLRQTPVPANTAVHGADGLGNLPGRLAHSAAPDARPAARFIVEMAQAQPGELTLVAVGPLGNLCQALRLEPRLPALLREVILMGGSIAEPGNVSPVAEANIWHDPHAADAVFTAGFQLTMVGLDVTHRMVMPLALFERIAARQQHPATDTLLQAVRHYADFYGGLYPALARTQACFGHDVLALMYLLHPELFSTESGRVRVVTEGLAQGQTIMNRRPALAYAQAGWGEALPLSSACLQVDAAACLDLFERTLLQNWLAAPA
jgi:inosine-uridine nucleoside N-ribohydrolase